MKSVQNSEATPIVIPAYNEAVDLPRTLESLTQSSHKVYPIVVDNGSTDSTAEVAHDFGVEVVSEPILGKMRATQTGLKAALLKSDGPVLFTDADTILGSHWAEAMIEACSRVDPRRGGAVFGKGVFTRGPVRSIDCIRSVYSLYRDSRYRFKGMRPIARGYNYGVVPDKGGRIVRGILTLPPNLFPGEDTAIRDLVIQLGGDAIAVTGIAAIARTKGDRVNSLGQAAAVYLGRQQRASLYTGQEDSGFVAYRPGITELPSTVD